MFSSYKPRSRLSSFIEGLLTFALVAGVFLLVALFGSLVMYAAWNWGLVGAVNFANSISLVQAFFLTWLPASVYVTVRNRS